MSLRQLPEPKHARRGLALTTDVMKPCRWFKPKLVAQVEFTEWTANGHLRHARLSPCVKTRTGVK
jgi:ATP-dependent DNA ligase